MPKNRTGGGVGSNQYRVRGRALAAPTLNPPAKISQRPIAGKVAARIALAEDPNTNDDTVVRLASDKSTTVLNAVLDRAGDGHHLPDQAYAMIHQSHPGNRDIRRRMASMPSCPPAVLERIAQDVYGSRDSDTELALVRNPATPPTGLHHLMHSESTPVLFELAQRSDLPVDTMLDLANDHKRPQLRWALAENPGATGEVVAKLSSLVDNNRDGQRLAQALSQRPAAAGHPYATRDA